MPRQFVNDFKENAYIAARTLPPSLQSVEYNVKESGSGTVPIDAFLCVPDYYYPEAYEAAVNYGTMGVTLGQILFLKAFPRDADKKKLEYYHLCHQNATKVLSGQTVNVGTASSGAKLHWVVNLIRTKVSTAKDSEKQRAQDQLYYARFCRTMCGAEEGRLLCNYSVHSPEFEKAFNCRGTPEVSC